MDSAGDGTSRLIGQVKLCFQEAQKEIAARLAHAMLSDLAEGVPHYIWVPSPWPEDPAGDLIFDGWFDPASASVRAFLDEYTGRWFPQYVPGPGSSWVTFRDRYLGMAGDWLKEICSEAAEPFHDRSYDGVESELLQYILDEIRRKSRTAACPDRDWIFRMAGLNPDRALLEFLDSYSEKQVCGPTGGCLHE